jgi:3-hydroxyisobutyrate dehydrogenase-like beta-hydroxyacid dehydrogenase
MDERIGVIGLGRMGRALAARLAARGCRVTGWTRRGIGAADAEALGIAAAPDLPAAVAASDVLLLSLFDDGAVRRCSRASRTSTCRAAWSSRQAPSRPHSSETRPRPSKPRAAV